MNPVAENPREKKELTPEDLACLLTGREGDLFLPDVEARREELREKLDGSRLLLLGGAGSVGSATLRVLLPFRPRTLHVIDQNENALAELVRDLRSGPGGLTISDFRVLPLDFGSPVMRRFLLENGPYDFVLNFAAVKHVRSEKDLCSQLQLLDTNVVKTARLLGWLSDAPPAKGFFCVSTDKAANPSSLMGASKRIMEMLVFARFPSGRPVFRASSARFANVAFSEGSLFDGILRRLRKGQPVAVPERARRYFITLWEAGEICLLASALAPDRHLLIPRLDPSESLVDLRTVAEAILRNLGFHPLICRGEEQARAAVDGVSRSRQYPLLLTSLDTAGEKPYEEFLATGEKPVEVGLRALLAVPSAPPDGERLAGFVRRVEDLVRDPHRLVQREELTGWISELVPEFRHVDSDRHLDERM